jgi:D-aspartate ligase
VEAVTAFVTGADHPTALGAARALRAAGHAVVGFTRHPDASACRSRAWTEVRAVSGPDARGMAEEVLAAAANFERPVFLLPTEDGAVGELSRIRSRLPVNVRMTLPPHAVVETLLEKTRFAEWAEREGFPLPRSGIANSREELQRLLDGFPMPAILKPLLRTPEWQRASPADKVFRLEKASDVERVPFDLFSVAPAYVLSEWVEGDDSDVLFCLTYLDPDSEIVASFTGRKLLQYPRLTGSTAICIDRPDPALEELTASLFRRAGCQGLASLEVKRSAANGRYYITEPTVGRPNLQSHAAVKAGVNLHGIALRHIWGLDFSDLLGPRRRCMWVEEQGLLEILTTRTGIPIPFRLIAGEALRARRVAGAYSSLTDPAPISSMVRGWIGSGVRRLRPGP